MKRYAPFNLKMYSPVSEAGNQQLAKQVAQVHAESVCAYIRQLNCPHSQKLQLLNAIITISERRLS